MRILAVLMVFVIVMATALMAIARKVIILDLDKVGPDYLWGIASIVLAISIGYWLVLRLPRDVLEFGPDKRRRRVGDRDDEPTPSTVQAKTPQVTEKE